MISKALLVGMCVFAATSLNDEPQHRLPKPRYEHRDSDPAWLESIVQFHGHLGPSIIAGARLGMAGLQAVDAKGYFDVEVTCEGPFVKPPQSCFLDGLQVSTGATMGKRNLNYRRSKRNCRSREKHDNRQDRRDSAHSETTGATWIHANSRKNSSRSARKGAYPST